MSPSSSLPDMLCFPNLSASSPVLPTFQSTIPRYSKKSYRKKRDGSYIPRPPNAFILFRSSFLKARHVSTEIASNHSTLSSIIGVAWNSLTEDQKQVWFAKAREARDEHRRRFPRYEFRRIKGAHSTKHRPLHIQPEDTKRCMKIAELWGDGKRGDELAKAVQAFDKDHGLDTNTRFTPPLTKDFFKIPEFWLDGKNGGGFELGKPVQQFDEDRSLDTNMGSIPPRRIPDSPTIPDSPRQGHAPQIQTQFAPPLTTKDFRDYPRGCSPSPLPSQNASSSTMRTSSISSTHIVSSSHCELQPLSLDARSFTPTRGLCAGPMAQEACFDRPLSCKTPTAVSPVPHAYDVFDSTFSHHNSMSAFDPSNLTLSALDVYGSWTIDCPTSDNSVISRHMFDVATDFFGFSSFFDDSGLGFEKLDEVAHSPSMHSVFCPPSTMLDRRLV